MTTIPTSGAFLRAFAGSSMTAGTRHVAEVIAAAISYDGKYRGAPKGHAAFTMAELQEATGLAARTIHAALQDLASLFGLVILRRHRQRHFFRFTRVSGQAIRPDAGRTDEDREAPPDAAVTGSQLPITPYIEEQKNNDCSVKVKIREGESVWRTPWASIIDRFKRGTPAETVDTQFLWTGFCGLNRRNGHEQVPLRFLIGFLKKYPQKRPAWTPPAPTTPAPAAPKASRESLKLVELARPAPFENRHFHQSDLQRRIGADAYEARVEDMMDRYACARFQAVLAVHGEAVKHGEIGR